MKKIFLILILVLPILIFQGLSWLPWVQELIGILKNYLWLYLLGVLILKILGVVYPPLPGVVFTVSSIPLIGWQWAYIIDLIGSWLGVTVAFCLGKKYGYSIIFKVMGEGLGNKIKKIKLKERNQLEAAIFIRFAIGGMLSDGLSWGASLIGFRYWPFMVGHVVSHLVTTLPIFVFVGVSISFNSWIIFAAAALVAWILIYKFKGRYFE